MPSANLNKALLIAVLDIIESWVDVDLAVRSYSDGLSTSAERNRDVSRANSKKNSATAVLDELLPPHAYTNLLANLATESPRPKAPPGYATQRWGKAPRRVSTAKQLLASAFHAEVRALAQEEVAKQNADRAAALHAVTAVRLAKEETRRRKNEALAAELLASRTAALRIYRDAAEKVFRDDFLGSDKWFDASGHSALMPHATYLQWKGEFVQQWAAREFPDLPIDSEQAIALASTTGDVHVQARAGSGKTRVMVLRAIFLQLHCGVAPEEIMLVAFNNKAVSEIEERLKNLLPAGTKLPLVLTFHALALAIADPRETIVVDDGADDRNLAEKVRQVVKDIERDRPDDVRRAMVKFYEEGCGDDATIKSPRQTFHGEYVKSPGELKVANALFSLGVGYWYEHRFDDVPYRYLPDFTLLEKDQPRAVIEYFGMVGDTDYDIDTETKRKIWASNPVPYIEMMPSVVRGRNHVDMAAWLGPQLRTIGIKTIPRTEEEIWNYVSDRAMKTFHTSISNFISRARKNRVSPQDLKALRRNHRFLSATEDLFVDLAVDAYARYLKAPGFDDFDGVLERAATEITRGKTAFKRHKAQQQGDVARLRFLHIDELQDLSPLFAHLVAAIRDQANDLSVFGVGDDWQLINSFAGSDPALFVAFRDGVRTESRLSISTNYRSTDSIVELGNRLMHGLGSDARPSRGPGIVPRCVQAWRLHGADTRSVGQRNEDSLRILINYVLQIHGAEIAVLSGRERVWSDGKMEVTLSSLEESTLGRQRDLVSFSTVHKFKGREAQSVILIAGDKNFPFVHPAWFLGRILGEQLDKIHDEERRLFYVGATRAMKNLYLFVPVGQAVCGWGSKVEEFDWTGIPRVGDLTSEVAVSVWPNDQMTVKLRELGFCEDRNTNRWIRRGPREGLILDAFDSDIGGAASGVEIRDASGTLLYSRGKRPAHSLPVRAEVSLKSW